MLKMTPKGSVGSYKFSRSTVELETNINPNSLGVNAVAVVAKTAAAAAVGNGKMSQGMPAEVLPPNLRDDEFHLHNLLENVDQGSDRDTSWRKYARLVLPHIGLVVFVCLYAMFGAWVFYSIESPHEDRLKVLGIRRVYKLRQALTGHLMERSRSGEQRGRWMATMEEQLNSFSEDLFKSYKEQYVRYENVRLSHHLHSPQQQQQQQLNQPPQMDPRFRRHFSKSRSDGKLWTPSSSLFFAATTMATIWIRTIGDLGKFLSECTIWLYRRLKDKFYYFRYSFTIFWLARRKKRRRRQFKKSFLHEMDAGGDFEEEFGDDDDDAAEAEAERRAREQLQRLKIKSVDDWDEQENTEVPVLLVFAILLLYIAAGGVLFAIMESRNQCLAFRQLGANLNVQLKVLGIRRVYKLRQALTGHLMERSRSGEQRGRWMATMEEQLNSFSEDLFKSYKEQYVRYENVRLSHHLHSPQQQQQQQLNQPPQMDPRFRRHFSKSRSDGKLWTPSSSLFFAATTMATIGYGNIVPVTSHGRIACIIFALFGAPLTIITIGDLGKFLSECTIWLYRRLKDKFYYFRYSFYHFLEEFGDDDDDAAEAEAERRAREQLQRLKIKSVDDWDEQENTEVPVLLVFAILLLYIAAGGVLFAIMESWTYMDAFYYCFVSLTTIGFGDLVPDRHEYIVLMLIYLGVGLAVTTMCIDLVGIQYIQKIHYFGRKFKGTDILQILRRKRMLERRFAMGEGKELIEYVIKHEREALFPSHQPRGMAQPVFHLASQAHSRDQPEEEKISLNSEQEMAPAEEARVQDVVPMKDLALARAMDIPRILEPTTPVERKLSSPTIETPSSESERLM
uniref:Ion_trans_2 domain-containing protein n=1 Tax=Globodera pallida TaxID=36090 RepID=A0A183BWP4_GLOPA